MNAMMSVGGGIALLVAILIVLVVFSVVQLGSKSGDGEEHDIEHLDHESRGDSTSH